MKIDLFGDEETPRVIGAVVIRPLLDGTIQVDLGPADGVPHVRLEMSPDEANELGTALQHLDTEQVLLFGD